MRVLNKRGPRPRPGSSSGASTAVPTRLLLGGGDRVSCSPIGTPTAPNSEQQNVHKCAASCVPNVQVSHRHVQGQRKPAVMHCTAHFLTASKCALRRTPNDVTFSSHCASQCQSHTKIGKHFCSSESCNVRVYTTFSSANVYLSISIQYIR